MKARFLARFTAVSALRKSLTPPHAFLSLSCAVCGYLMKEVFLTYASKERQPWLL